MIQIEGSCDGDYNVVLPFKFLKLPSNGRRSDDYVMKLFDASSFSKRMIGVEIEFVKVSVKKPLFPKDFYGLCYIGINLGKKEKELREKYSFLQEKEPENEENEEKKNDVQKKEEKKEEKKNEKKKKEENKKRKEDSDEKDKKKKKVMKKKKVVFEEEEEDDDIIDDEIFFDEDEDEMRRKSKKRENAVDKSNSNTKSKSVVKSNSVTRFNDLFKDMRFCISGLQNPKRAEIRDKACAMGARYVADWNDQCTHLFCAFSGTPKYKLVQESKYGIALKYEYVDDCFKSKCRLDEQDYMFEGSKAMKRSKTNVEEITPKNLSKSLSKSMSVPMTFPDEEENDVFEAPTEEEEEEEKKEISKEKEEEEEEEKKEEKQKKKEENDYSFETIPNLFGGSKFVVRSTKEKLKRIIIALGGVVEDELSDSFSYVVVDNEEEGKKIYNQIEDLDAKILIKSDWIAKCWKLKKRVSVVPYKIKKKSD